jgi:hypothetical protein
VLTADGVELIRVDGSGVLKVEGRRVAVPIAARADLESYVAGFRILARTLRAPRPDPADAALCRTLAALQRTERALQSRILAFPAYIAPVATAL